MQTQKQEESTKDNAPPLGHRRGGDGGHMCLRCAAKAAVKVGLVTAFSVFVDLMEPKRCLV